MADLNRRMFLASAAAAGSLRAVPRLGGTPRGRWIVKLVYDKSLGMMRAVERLVY